MKFQNFSYLAVQRYSRINLANYTRQVESRA